MTEHVNVASRPSDTVTFCSCPMNVGIPPNASTGKRNFVFIFSEKILHMFCSSHFWFLVTFGNEVTKIQKYYVIFVYILQGQMGKTEKKGKKITQLKWPKYQKPKDENMGWTKQKKRKWWEKKSMIWSAFHKLLPSYVIVYEVLMIKGYKNSTHIFILAIRTKKLS